MRILTFITTVILSCATISKATPRPGQLDGTWVPVRQEVQGSALSSEVFEHQVLVVSDSLYTVTAESVDKGIVRYADGKMDIYSKEGVNAGKHFTGIYKYVDGQLTICYNLAGNSYPKAFETESNNMFFLAVFRKK